MSNDAQPPVGPPFRLLGDSDPEGVARSEADCGEVLADR
jgi:hypothetical protein